jgi:hypothetical protein
VDFPGFVGGIAPAFRSVIMRLHLVLGLGLVVLASCAFGCSAPSGGNGKAAPASTDADGGAADPSAKGAAAETGLTCSEIVDCATKCGETDEACQDACLAKGSSSGQAAANALVACANKNACADENCLHAKCEKEITGCTSQKNATGGGSSSPGGAGGSAPAAIVGAWNKIDGESPERWTFAADGTATHRLTMSTGLGSCTNTFVADTEGTVVFTATTLTFTETAGKVVSNECGVEKTEDANLGTSVYTWSIDGQGQLVTGDRNAQECLTTPPYPTCAATFVKE